MGLLSRKTILKWAFYPEMLLPHGHAQGYPGLLWYPKGFREPNQNPDLGILFPNGPIDPGIQSIPTQIIGWIRNLPKSGLFGKIQKLAANLWSRNVKIQHGLLGEPGRNPDYLRNCTPFFGRMIEECQSNTDWAITRSAIHLLSKIRFQKSKHHLFQMVPNFGFFWQKKRRNYWPRARAERNPDTAKNLSNQGWHCFLPLHTLLVPNALPQKRTPQTVLRQGCLGHYYKSFPDNWDQVFLR